MSSIRIENLVCRYSSNQPKVLHIPKLTFESGNLYFILGKSGIGKSTLIETLGMMENTIDSKEKTVLEISTSGGGVSIPQLWRKSSDEISKFRREQFSFIFQSTNLFSHLSIFENAMMPVWINQDAEYSKAIDKVNNLFRDLLPKIFNKRLDGAYERSISSISGGQRQRLAFIRALAAPYRILFGDEPTGNLDVATARKLINILKDEILGTSKTACLVSHDIDLAMQHANVIIGLSEGYDKKTSSTFGTVTNRNVIKRVGDIWEDQDGLQMDDESVRTLLVHILK